jgi:hypothetical protein
MHMKALNIMENHHMSHYQSHSTSNEMHTFEMIDPPPSHMLELITCLTLEFPGEIYQRQTGIMKFYREEVSTIIWSKNNSLKIS